MYDDDSPVVAGSWAGGSSGKGKRGRGALEKARRTDVAGGEEHEHRLSRSRKEGNAEVEFITSPLEGIGSR